MITQGSNHQEDLILNIYLPNKRDLKYMVKKPIGLQGETIKLENIVRDYNTSIQSRQNKMTNNQIKN